MDHIVARRWDPFAAGAALIGSVASLWIGLLLLDQVVFFADAEQTRQAAEARVLMVPATLVAIGAALIVGLRVTSIYGAAVGVAAVVPAVLTWLDPGSAYGLVAYVLAAPIAVGAAVAVAFPLARTAPRTTVVVAAVVFIGSIITMSILGILPSGP